MPIKNWSRKRKGLIADINRSRPLGRDIMPIRKSKSKVLVVSQSYSMYSSYYRPFAHLGEQISNDRMLNFAPHEIACAVFTGGADVNPIHYGHKPAKWTLSSPWRDEYELGVMATCVQQGVPMMGICRGAQLMNVFAGGTLCQHLDNHSGTDHDVDTEDGNVVSINSYHHQMMLPPDDAEVLAWCVQSRSGIYLGDGGEQIDVDREIEVVHYPDIKGLAVQYHPEMHDKNDEGWDYYQKLIAEFLAKCKVKNKTMLRTG